MEMEIQRLKTKVTKLQDYARKLENENKELRDTAQNWNQIMEKQQEYIQELELNRNYTKKLVVGEEIQKLKNEIEKQRLERAKSEKEKDDIIVDLTKKLEKEEKKNLPKETLEELQEKQVKLEAKRDGLEKQFNDLQIRMQELERQESQAKREPGKMGVPDSGLAVSGKSFDKKLLEEIRKQMEGLPTKMAEIQSKWRSAKGKATMNKNKIELKKKHTELSKCQLCQNRAEFICNVYYCGETCQKKQLK
jgi:chromosome segregation ATPase